VRDEAAETVTEPVSEGPTVEVVVELDELPHATATNATTPRTKPIAPRPSDGRPEGGRLDTRDVLSSQIMSERPP